MRRKAEIIGKVGGGDLPVFSMDYAAVSGRALDKSGGTSRLSPGSRFSVASLNYDLPESISTANEFPRGVLIGVWRQEYLSF